ncbi:hypothetical protein Taro_013185 [Colocasia esculenta]|uniref:Uncharacterized protein n=1 Tax=Colocasia esculenta TaxID=4460 RepID=A0A843UFI8_COLES|nr:hypothetical protein [Colocasia esculenta]
MIQVSKEAKAVVDNKVPNSSDIVVETKVWRIPDSDQIGFFLIRSDSDGSNRFGSIRLHSARTLIEGIRVHRSEPRIGSSLIRCDSGGSARLDPARQTMVETSAEGDIISTIWDLHSGQLTPVGTSTFGPWFVVAERIGPIRPYRSGSWAGRCVIRKDPPAGRVSEDPLRSAPIRRSATLRPL